jgi:hypothetical protein
VDVLSLILTLSFGGCVFCTFEPFFWWMCCLYFSPCPLVDVLSVPFTLSFGGCVVCTFHLVLWWMCCLYLRKHIHQKKGSKLETTHPLKDRGKSTDNISTKRKGKKYRKHIHQKAGTKEQTNTSTRRQGQNPVIWWMCCLYFSPCPLVDVLSVPFTLSFGGCVVYFWWMCCLYSWPCLLVDVLSVLLTLSFGGCVVCTFALIILHDLWNLLKITICYIKEVHKIHALLYNKSILLSVL